MVWTLELSRQAQRQLRKLEVQQADRITRNLIDIARLDNPRDRGVAMSGNYAGYWRYRIGNHRVIARIEDERIVITVIAIGHRREVYR